MGCSPTDSSKGTVLVDAIHGDIHLTSREVKVLNTASFQRLRHIKQLQMSQMTYPNATHTRFAHSLGALAIMKKTLHIAEENNGIKLPEDLHENLRLAALLHDIGHYPYSHLMERLDNVKLTEDQLANGTQKRILLDTTPYPHHETLGRLIITNQTDIIEAVGGEAKAKDIAEILNPLKSESSKWGKLIHSSLDLDRLDYLLRDSHAVGVPYGQIDINYLLNAMIISPKQELGFSEKALPAVEHLLLARFFMHRTVYYHKTTYGIEEACRQLLRRLRDRTQGGAPYHIPVDGQKVEELIQSPRLSAFTDAFVDNIVRQAVSDEDATIQALARSIQTRRPPRMLNEVCVCEEGQQQYHAGRTFLSNCKGKLQELANSSGIPVGQFLLCKLDPLTIGEHPKKFTANQTRSLDAEQLDELSRDEDERDIKVFLDGETEPTSLLDVPHSIIGTLAKYPFRIFRLYVVYDGDNDADVIGKLRDTVKDWHKD